MKFFTIRKINNLQSEEKYDEAIEMVDSALKTLPRSNELISKKEKIIAEKPQSFMDVCEPYETSYNYKKFVNGETFQMSGQDRTNGFTIMGYNNQALSNLNGKYRELSFDVGHIDGAEMLDATLSIYLDEWKIQYIGKGKSALNEDKKTKKSDYIKQIEELQSQKEAVERELSEMKKQLYKRSIIDRFVATNFA